jgi:hypothetical protein
VLSGVPPVEVTLLRAERSAFIHDDDGVPCDRTPCNRAKQWLASEAPILSTDAAPNERRLFAR